MLQMLKLLNQQNNIEKQVSHYFLSSGYFVWKISQFFTQNSQKDNNFEMIL